MTTTDHFPCLTHHAAKRLSQRGVSESQLRLVIEFGRKVHAHRAIYYIVGKKEIGKYQGVIPGFELLEGIQVVVNSSDDVVLTVFRNHSFRRIRSYKRRRNSG